MNFEASPKQALVLWSLLISEDIPAQSKIKPELKVKERQELVDAGLIELVERKQLREEGLTELKGRAKHIRLTDKAWDWAVENTTIELSKSTAAVPVLTRLIEKVNSFLNSSEASWSEILVSKIEKVEVSGNENSQIEDAIVNAYRKLHDGNSLGIRLSALRPHLQEFSRQEVDDVLNRMYLSEKLDLVPIDDPQDISEEDEAAAIDFDGDKRYIVDLELL